MSKSRKSVAGIIALIVVIVSATLVYGYRQYTLDHKPYSIIFIPKIIDNNNEFWSSCIAGVKMAAEEYEVSVDIVAPEQEEDYTTQNQLIREAIKKNPDAIILAPSHYTQTTMAAKEVKDAGIHLVFIDSEVDEEISEALVATDNFVAGIKIGTEALGYLSSTTQIGIIGHVRTSSTAMERIRGVEYALDEYKNQIVETLFCDSDFGKAYDKTLELLEHYPEVDLLIGTNEYAAVGCAKAVKKLGLTGKVKVIGFDNSLEEIQLLEEGVFQAIVVQNPFAMGYLGMKEAVKLIKNQGVEKFVDSGSQLITVENMYEKENQKLLFPFVGSKFRD